MLIGYSDLSACFSDADLIPGGMSSPGTFLHGQLCHIERGGDGRYLSQGTTSDITSSASIK